MGLNNVSGTLPNLPRLLLVGLTVVTFLFLLLIMSTSTGAFGLFNPAWDGSSSLREQASAAGTESIIVTDTSEYGRVSPNESVAIILSPDSQYS
jgi:hypothetical protein